MTEETYKIELNVTEAGLRALMNTERCSPDNLHISEPATDLYIKEVLKVERVKTVQLDKDFGEHILLQFENLYGERVLLRNRPKVIGEHPMGGEIDEPADERYARLHDYSRPLDYNEWELTVGDLIYCYIGDVHDIISAIESAKHYMEHSIIEDIDDVPSLVFKDIRLRDIRHPNASIIDRITGLDGQFRGTLVIPLQ